MREAYLGKKTNGSTVNKELELLPANFFARQKGPYTCTLGEEMDRSPDEI